MFSQLYKYTFIRFASIAVPLFFLFSFHRFFFLFFWFMLCLLSVWIVDCCFVHNFMLYDFANSIVQLIEFDEMDFVKTYSIVVIIIDNIIMLCEILLRINWEQFLVQRREYVVWIILLEFAQRFHMHNGQFTINFGELKNESKKIMIRKWLSVHWPHWCTRHRRSTYRNVGILLSNASKTVTSPLIGAWLVSISCFIADMLMLKSLWISVFPRTPLRSAIDYRDDTGYRKNEQLLIRICWSWWM